MSLLGQCPRFLFHLLGTSVAAASGIVRGARNVDVLGERAAAFTKNGVGKTGAAALGNLQRLAKTEIELHEDRIGSPIKGRQRRLIARRSRVNSSDAEAGEAGHANAVRWRQRIQEPFGGAKRRAAFEPADVRFVYRDHHHAAGIACLRWS